MSGCLSEHADLISRGVSSLIYWNFLLGRLVCMGWNVVAYGAWRGAYLIRFYGGHRAKIVCLAGDRILLV